MFSLGPISACIVLRGVDFGSSDAVRGVIVIVDVNGLFDGHSLDDDGWRGLVVVVVGCHY